MLSTPDVRNLHEQVYEPAEDLFLLLDCFEQDRAELMARFAFPVVCEIGAGSGVVLSFVAQHLYPKGYAVATDINPHACSQVVSTFRENHLRNGVEMMQMSLGDGLRPGVVDLLVFNPPYVPAEEVPARPQADDDPVWLDLALLGGADGMETTWQVLDNLDTLLSRDGIAYILFCARNHPDAVAATMRERGWQVSVAIHRKAAWEVLSVLRFHR